MPPANLDPVAPTQPPEEIVREPYGFVYKDPSPIKEVYGGPSGQVFIECMRIRPVHRPSKTVLVFTHPIGGGAFLPLVTALARAGRHVIYCNPRYRGNDTALILEKCVLDLGACIADLKRRFGYEKVVLGGWSGGGSLALFYQDQAEHPSLTTTPAGDPVDLVSANLHPADGVLLLAAHIGRSVTLTEWLDPSVQSETDPTMRDLEFSLYDRRCPHQPPYAEAFVERFREAQRARNRRITAWAWERLEDMRRRGEGDRERPFVVYGTMMDVRWRDQNQDRSDRKPGVCYLGDPSIANDGPVGLARFTTLRSWLSQWSYDESRANGVLNGARISCPLLVVNNTADLACTPSHARRLFAAAGCADKSYADVLGADHYYAERPDLLPTAVSLIESWLALRAF